MIVDTYKACDAYSKGKKVRLINSPDFVWEEGFIWLNLETKIKEGDFNDLSKVLSPIELLTKFGFNLEEKWEIKEI